MVQPDKQYPSLESVSDLYGRVSSFFEADADASVVKTLAQLLDFAASCTVA